MAQQNVGPGGKTKLIITSALSDLIQAHNKYQANLSVWEKYLIFRYTLGSSSVNAKLVGISEIAQIIDWTYKFFKYYNYRHYGLNSIKAPFDQWINYFINPKTFLNLPINRKQYLANRIISEFISALQTLILKAPPTLGDITVYKVSSYYPDLPTKLIGSKRDKIVAQKPFNSTTYDPTLNFIPFLGVDKSCCFFQIIIPRGSRVLAIDLSLHAYPHEREILLPFGSSFDIYSIGTDILNYISPADQKYLSVQQLPLVFGEVFRLDPVCFSHIRQQSIKTYFARVIT